MIHPSLHSIPPANRRLGNLARIARFGKGKPRVSITQEAPTSFQPRVVASDPRIRKAREVYRAALRQRWADIEQAIIDAASPEEAKFWQDALQRMIVGK